jgi:hypothetical protein
MTYPIDVIKSTFTEKEKKIVKKHLSGLREAKLTKKETEALNKSLRVSKRKQTKTYPDDLRGFRFGKLVVLYKIVTVPGQEKALWECATDCGTTTQATSLDLISGRAKSCDFIPGPPKK